MPKPSLPVRLGLLVAGTALPLIVFATFIVLENYEHDRKDASQRVLETVRSIRLVLDAEVKRMTGGLEVLALTNTLRDGNFGGFRRMSSGFLEQYGKDGILLVADREGRQLFSSATPDTSQPSPAQQPRNRGEGVRNQAAAIFQSVPRRDEQATDRDGRGSGAARRRGHLRHFVQPSDRDLPVHPRQAAPQRRLDDLDLRQATASTSRAFQIRKRRSASVHRLRFMKRCFASAKPRCRRYRRRARR